MDGFEKLIEADVWKKLEIAKDAVFAFQRSMEKSGFASDYAYASRSKLTDAENQLRHHFKQEAHRGD